MSSTEAGITRAPLNPVQPWNADSPMMTSVLESVRDPSPTQPLNAFALISVTELGIVRLVNPVQPWNTDTPMDVRVLESVKLVNP